MAAEPYSFGVPSVGAEGAPANDYQHIDAPAGAFGAYSAQALKETASNLDTTGNNLAKIADLQQTRYNEIAHQQTVDQFLNGVQDITWGTPEKQGVLQKQGADALGAREQAETDIEKLRQQIRGGLTNQAQQIAFDQTSRFYQLREKDRIGAHVDGQLRTYGIDQAKAGIQSAAMRAGADPTSDLDTLSREAYLRADNLTRSRDGAAADPTTVDVGRRVAAGTVVYSRLNALADTNPAAAADVLKNGTIPSPDGKGRMPIQSVLDESGRTQLSQKIQAKSDMAAGTGAAIREFNGASSRGARAPFTPASLPPGVTLNEDAMVRTVAGEAGQEPLRGQQAVAAVIMNRANGSGASPRDVVFAPNQFEPWNGGAARQRLEAMDPNSAEYQNILKNVVRPVMAGQAADPTGGATHFYAQVAQAALGRQAPQWASGAPTVIGGHNFYNVGYGPGSAPRAAIGAQPTVNDAQGPIPGSSRRQALQNIINDPALKNNPQALSHAMTVMDHMFTQDDHAAHVDAEAAFNEWIPQVRLNPASVDPTKIMSDPRLTGEQKSNLAALLSDKSQGDGPAFTQAYQNVYTPVGTPGRINSVGDLFSLAGHGLTARGMETLQKVIKERDQPESLVQKAAMDGFRHQIEGTAGSPLRPGPISSAKWAQFLGWALPEIDKEKSAGKTMAQIISPTGDIAKAVQNYTLTQQELVANRMPAAMVAPAGGSITAPAPPPATAPGPQLRSGAFYTPGPNRTFVPADATNPLARRYNGGPMFAPQGWDVAAPSAPTTER